MDRITLGLLSFFGLLGLVFWLGGRLATKVSELVISWLKALADIRGALREFRSDGRNRATRAVPASPRDDDGQAAPQWLACALNWSGSCNAWDGSRLAAREPPARGHRV
ncbi:hypothetical protein [Streptomyces lushanensis]|uniref:hypothetical protein n=1 Tax=Streptomyces lushanensis TaxID=1434255 RepID=UPI00114CCE07|nr:hypothetical protein [Streptomyces lushanensis]